MDWIEQTISRVENLSLSGIVPLVLLATFSTLFLVYAAKTTRQHWLINKVPGPKTYPIIGNLLDCYVDSKELFKLITGKFCDYDSSISRIWLGWIPCCYLFKANAVEAILSNQKYIDKADDYRFLQPWLGLGLLTSSGKKWHRRRKLLTPTFHFKILEDFVEVFNQQSFILVDKLASKVDGKPFDIFKYITLCTLDIILETAMGRSINAQGDSDSEYVKAVTKLSELVIQRSSRLWYHIDFIFNHSKKKIEQDDAIKILHGFSNDIIKEKRKLLQNSTQSKTQFDNDDDVIGKKKRLAFMDLLLESTEDGKSLSNEDIREEVDTFVFEGHDTTAAAINWALYLFGSNPIIQDKAYEEIYSIFGDDSDRPITSTDLKQLKYLECCLKEALRLFPSVPFFGRHLKEDVMIDGYQIPSGTTVMIIVYKLHRDPEVFPDPEEFQPERFLPENCANRHPYAYVPFSAGPRNCIGQKFAQMEEKIVITNFLRKYRVESTVKREDLSLLGELIIRPEDGTFVKILKRKNN